jgi:hypothetical protein
LPHRVAPRVDVDQHQRELAVFAHGKVDLAAQLILKVCAGVQTDLAVAQPLILDFSAQRLVGPLFSFQLLQRAAQLRILQALDTPVVPDAAQKTLATLLDDLAQHGEVSAHACPLEAVVGNGSVAASLHRQISRAQVGGQHALEDISIGEPCQGRSRLLQKSRHATVHVHIAARGRILDTQQKPLLLKVHRQQSGQDGRQPSG